MKTNPNDPVQGKIVPLEIDGVDHSYGFPGLSKREYFAAMAMQGILASEDRDNDLSEDRLGFYSVKCADALISELNKEAKE